MCSAHAANTKFSICIGDKTHNPQSSYSYIEQYMTIHDLKHLPLPEQHTLHPHFDGSSHNAALGANYVQCGTQTPLALSQPNWMAMVKFATCIGIVTMYVVLVRQIF